jgi:predicted RNase H-like HicB family nuclease
MTRQFNVLVERDAEGFFVATVPSLPGCHTQARSLDQLMERVREASELYIEVEGELAGELDFVGGLKASGSKAVTNSSAIPMAEPRCCRSMQEKRLGPDC